VKVNLNWIDPRCSSATMPPGIWRVDGILVPGGFGERGTEGKIRAVRFARERKVPFSASASACRWR
jgi:CTP synthase